MQQLVFPLPIAPRIAMPAKRPLSPNDQQMPSKSSPGYTSQLGDLFMAPSSTAFLQVAYFLK
jgi:hypothetical protein